MVSFIFEIGVVVAIAALISLIGRAIKQPPIIAYLITGIIVGPLFFNLLQDVEIVKTFGHLGVAFLLFVVGLSLDFKVLKDLGKISALAGIGSMVVVSVISFAIAIGFGLMYKEALYIAAALAFSSTVVVVKLLSDKREIDTLHGKIALGILIVEDFVAALMLMIVPVLGAGDFSVILIQLIKAAALVGAVIFGSIFLVPGIFSLAARNQEVLFLSSIAWALIIAMLFDGLGFSLEIGALLAGMALAQSKYSMEISSKMKTLRDFFVVLFFVYFGSLLAGPISWSLFGKALIFSAFILIGKPLVVMGFMRAFGYKKRTNFFAGVGLAQISEFSLILLALGFSLGVLGQEILSLGILIALITIALSSYSIYYSQQLFNLFSPLLGMFEGGKKEASHIWKDSNYDVILFGYNRIGFNLVKAFDKAHKKYVIIDYNPKIILDLSKRGVSCIYGDANDLELLADLPLSKAKVIISTIPDYDTNLSILKAIGKKEVVFIPTSHSFEDTLLLYEEGADYVIMPHFLGGAYVADILLKDGFSRNLLEKEGKKQKAEMKERFEQGHTHPHKDNYGK